MEYPTATLSVSSPTLEHEPIIEFLLKRKIESKITPSTSIVVRDGIASREASVEILLIGKNNDDLERVIHLAWKGVKESNHYIMYGHLQTKDFDGCTIDYFSSYSA